MRLSLLTTALLGATAIDSQALAGPLTIINPSFETGTEGSSTITGWTNNVGSAEGFFINTGSNETFEPNMASSGTNWVTANRTAKSPDATSQGTATSTNFFSSTLTQQIDLSSLAAQIDGGGGSVNLTFDYALNDDNADEGIVTLKFLDVAMASVGSATTGALAETPSSGASNHTDFVAAQVGGNVPIGTRFLEIELFAEKFNSGTVVNVAFDNFAATFDAAAVPEPAGIAIWSLLGLGMAGYVCLAKRRAARSR